MLRTGRKLPFASEDKAVEWLEASGYVPAERAIRVGLVSQAPPRRAAAVEHPDDHRH